jgi:hypothetical protein
MFLPSNNVALVEVAPLLNPPTFIEAPLAVFKRR